MESMATSGLAWIKLRQGGGENAGQERAAAAASPGRQKSRVTLQGSVTDPGGGSWAPQPHSSMDWLVTPEG